MLAVFALVLAATANAQCVNTTGTSNPYAASTCSGYVSCMSTLCSCSGATGTGSTCLSTVPTTTTCATLQTCFSSYYSCLHVLSEARLNTSNPCRTWALTMHQALLAAALGTYAGSVLQTNCRGSLCAMMNTTSKTCNFGTDDSNICNGNMATTTAAATTAANTTTAAGSVTTTPAGDTTVAGTVLALTAQIRLSGNSYGALLNDPAKRSQLTLAIRVDLSGLLGIDSSYVVIISLTIGSLVIDFGVKEGSNATTASLVSTINTASSSTTWLTGVKSVYATVSNETIAVLSSSATEVTTTAAGGTINDPLSSASSVAFLAAAVLAVAALVLA